MYVKRLQVAMRLAHHTTHTLVESKYPGADRCGLMYYLCLSVYHYSFLHSSTYLHADAHQSRVPIIEKHTNAIRYNEEGQVRAGAAQSRSSSTCHRIIAHPQHQQNQLSRPPANYERDCPQYCERPHSGYRDRG